jgi:alpha-mannosidase
LEDFPTHHEGDQAQGLLANWCALWHPALLASAGAIPSWHRAESPPEEVANALIVIPGVSQSELPTGFVQRAEQKGAVVLSGLLDRAEIVTAALERVASPPLDPSLAADFLALAYCYLQVQLLTRQMRYSSNLDEIHFQNRVIAAATALVEGNADEAKDALSSCFDILAEERDHYYPVDAFILDLTMVTDATIGRPLEQQLARGTSNLLISAGLLQQIAEQEPATLAAIKRALAEGRLGLLGGEADERKLPLLSPETVLAQLRCGAAGYTAILGQRPSVFGRRRFGLTPLLPQVLRKVGLETALHVTLEEGVFPQGSQVKIRWEGSDGTSIDAIAKSPHDAAKPQVFLNYGVKLGESMDMDHVATVCLAHWPGTPSVWYDDLRRIAGYGSALGKLVTVNQYFSDTDLPVHQDRFAVDKYRSPYLRQAVAANEADPLSSVARYWRRRTAAEAAHALDTLSVLVAGRLPPDRAAGAGAPVTGAADLLAEIDACDDPAPVIDDQLRELAEASAQRLAEALPRGSGAAQSGYLVANPHSFVRRVGVQMPELASLPDVQKPVYSASAAGAARYVVVDVPPMGFAWVAPGHGAGRRTKKAEEPLAEDGILRNEFFEARIDPKTGGLRAIHEYGARGNRLSQQVAFRLADKPQKKSGEWQDSSAAELYSRMVAESVKTTVCTASVAEIVATGRLLDHAGGAVATFQQTYRVWRGSRVLQLEIELDPRTECGADPWSSYYAARFAWADESAELFRAVNGSRYSTTAKRFEAPLYVELNDGSARTSILTGGLPYHRRQGPRMLDTLLVVRGETQRRFELGIGIELKHPLQEALGILTPATLVHQTAAAPVPSDSGWLFHIDARNVTATHWEPLLEQDVVQGVRVRLQETGGRPAKAGLQCFRPARTARQTDFQNQPIDDCPIEDGRIQVQLAAHQWVQIEARW